MSEAAKDELRAVVRKFDAQKKSNQYYEHYMNPGYAVLRFSPEQDRVRANNKGKVRAGIKLHAGPIPSAAGFLTGIPH